MSPDCAPERTLGLRAKRTLRELLRLRFVVTFLREGFFREICFLPADFFVVGFDFERFPTFFLADIIAVYHWRRHEVRSQDTAVEPCGFTIEIL